MFAERRYDDVLEERPPNAAPFRVEMRETIFDFAGDPRYDIDAMRARTVQMRKETAELIGRT